MGIFVFPNHNFSSNLIFFPIGIHFFYFPMGKIRGSNNNNSLLLSEISHREMIFLNPMGKPSLIPEKL
jgi:hypothetical protein